MKGNLRSIRVAAIAGAAIFMAEVPTFAHHPFDGEFDWMKPVTLAGTITRVGWDEPHATIAIQPQDQGATRWLVELGSRRVLEKKYEWIPNVVKVGDNITVDGWLAKDGRRFVSAKSVTLSNGKQLFGASSFYDLPGTCISDEVCVKDGPSSYYEPSTTGQR
jgi:Family of unknown function (DUF6152)